MKIILIAVLAAAALTGCVAYPVGGYYSNGPAYVEPSYYWEPSIGLWFYGDHGGRHYMNRGWAPHGGHGGWRR